MLRVGMTPHLKTRLLLLAIIGKSALRTVQARLKKLLSAVLGMLFFLSIFLGIPVLLIYGHYLRMHHSTAMR